MRKIDFLTILIIGAILSIFILVPEINIAYKAYNSEYGMIMSFFKFAILATFGEMIGLRIRTGYYNKPGFGIIPRALVWGIIGLTINMAFIIFNTGTIKFLEYMGLHNATNLLSGNLSWGKLLVAFCISCTLNIIYAPVMMTFHKITDMHIVNNGGSIAGFFRPLKMGELMEDLNWKVQWNFVFKKTIPFFWIPAHTITFLLPADYRVLFAAILGIVLGVLLAIAAIKKS
ncbi:MAG: Mpv17/PMP22 family protein [Bacteroidota bacterium]